VRGPIDIGTVAIITKRLDRIRSLEVSIAGISVDKRRSLPKGRVLVSVHDSSEVYCSG
jgi:hypothetical protein